MRQKKGFIFVFVVIVAISLTLMAGATSLSLFYRHQVYIRYIYSVKAHYLALSGVRYVKYITPQILYWYAGLKETPPAIPDRTISITGMPGSITVKQEITDADVTTITSTATLNNISKRIVCAVATNEEILETYGGNYSGYSETCLPTIKCE